jgi:hypothetical protein
MALYSRTLSFSYSPLWKLPYTSATYVYATHFTFVHYPNTGSQDEARNCEPLKLQFTSHVALAAFLTLDAVRTWISHVGKVTLIITDNHASMKRMWFHIRYQSTFVICNLRKHCGTCPCIWFMTLKVNSFDRNVCFTTIGLLYTSFIYRQGCGNVAHILVLHYVRIVLCEMQCSVVYYYTIVLFLITETPLP